MKADVRPKSALRAGGIRLGLVAAISMIAGTHLAAPAMAEESCEIRIGRVVPVTGALALAGKMTPWVDEHKTKPVNDGGGIELGGKKCKVGYAIYDSQSTVSGAIEAANRAILQDKVDLLVLQYAGAATDVCERNGTPCISTTLPIEAWLLGPDGKPRTFQNTYHFFFGVPDLVKNHIAMIQAQPGGFNGKVGYLYPNDADGVVFASLFGPAITAAGWTPVDPGRFSEGLPDFSSIVNQFKRNHVEVVMGVLSPPDLQNYLQQAAQAGFKPKTYVIDKGTGYAESMQAIGQAGDGILSVNAWSPAFPGKSAYGGWTGAELADAFQKDNPDRQYSLTLGYEDAAYDVALDALRRAGTTKAADVIKAIGETEIDSVVGKIKFNAQHYSVQPLGGAQWRYDEPTKHWIKENVFNAVYPDVGKTAEMRLYQQ